MYKRWQKSTIDVSIITSSFLVYIFAVTIESVEASHNWHYLLSFRGCLPCTVQHEIRWYTWKHIFGLILELCWSGSVLEGSIRGNYEQQQKKYFQCGNTYFYYIYAHISAIDMVDAVLSICLPYGMT